MTNPIVDPATLTEEQREAIKGEYDLNVEWEDEAMAKSKSIGIAVAI